MYNICTLQKDLIFIYCTAVQRHIVYRIIFDSSFFRPSKLVNGFDPFWIRPDTVVLKKII